MCIRDRLRLVSKDSARSRYVERPGRTYRCEVAAAGTATPPIARTWDISTSPTPGRPSLGKDAA
eukprot:5035824-Alexandrium_andersonii.AAC.1